MYGVAFSFFINLMYIALAVIIVAFIAVVMGTAEEEVEQFSIILLVFPKIIITITIRFAFSKTELLISAGKKVGRSIGP